jgi:hypothetical protein
MRGAWGNRGARSEGGGEKAWAGRDVAAGTPRHKCRLYGFLRKNGRDAIFAPRKG